MHESYHVIKHERETDLPTLFALKWGMTWPKVRNLVCQWRIIQIGHAYPPSIQMRYVRNKTIFGQNQNFHIMRQVLHTNIFKRNWTYENHLWKKKKKAYHDIICKGAVHMHLKPKTGMHVFLLSSDATDFNIKALIWSSKMTNYNFQEWKIRKNPASLRNAQRILSNFKNVL